MKTTLLIALGAVGIIAAGYVALGIAAYRNVQKESAETQI